MHQNNNLIGLGILSLCVNFGLMIVKITTGVIGNCYALIADGIESAGDIFSSLITWGGVQLSLIPPDENHPYGHGKFESLAGMFSGTSLIIAATLIAWNSIKEIITPHYAPAWFTLPVLILVVIIKEVLSRKVMAAGEAMDSQAIKGDAWHHRSDAITSGAAAIGISIAMIGGKGYEMADDWGALIACIIIYMNGFIIFKGSLHEVVDGNVKSEVNASIINIAKGIQGVVEIEKCRLRKSGFGIFAELHVQVASDMTVKEGHRIGHVVKDTIMEKDDKIRDVVIHLEPAER